MSTTGPQSRSRDPARPYRNKSPATSTSTRSGPECAAPQHLVGLHLVGPTRPLPPPPPRRRPPLARLRPRPPPPRPRRVDSSAAADAPRPPLALPRLPRLPRPPRR
eukprot:scaffold137965_cov124-Phaeocystis_antarctica.AAC.1